MNCHRSSLPDHQDANTGIMRPSPFGRYFTPVNGPKPKGAILRSTRHALGPSFGSLCLASWLLNLIQMLRSMLDNARRENQGNLCMALLISCLDCIYQVGGAGGGGVLG